MIKNIIFDLGNVLLNFDPIEYVKSKVIEDKVEEIYKSIFKSEEWPMLDRGAITEEEARTNIINRKIENTDFINSVFENWYDILNPIETSVEVLKKLKEKGYKVFYLSNFHFAAFEYVTKKHDFFELFDGGVVSYKEKLLKPEKEIYEKIVDKYEIEPSETVFIDDMQVNVEAAMKLGIKGIILDDPQNLKLELKKLEVNI
ncbi:HAD family phosphatase [Clostridium sp.]|uniref:HAD family hydrolase n=1 Tax=Clostridium sp. TaxID=1506 RepID=UPI0028419CFD|nr:HAD family phosphatase [Clostridium sp.]MDR3598632.1 HAD family phosphatase [Clostridium sp.]